MKKLLFAATLTVSAACGGSQPVPTPSPVAALDIAAATVSRAVYGARREVAIPRERAEAMMREGIALMAQGRATEAADVLSVVAAALPNWYSYRAAYAQALWVGRHQPDAALDVLERCLELAPGSLECRRVRGAILAERGDSAGAIADFRVVVAHRPDDVDTTERLARLLVEAGASDQALDVLREAAAQAPHRVSLHLLLARTLEAAARIAEARAVFEWVRDIHRDSVQGGTYLLRFLERNGFDRDAARLRREIEREIERRTPDRHLRPL